MQHAAFEPPPPPPPERPELPEGVAPRWPAWYAGVGFLVALIFTVIVVGIVAAATGASTDDETPTFTVIATFLQGLIFIGTAVMFASFTRTPRPEHFGLRPTRFWPAVGWAAAGMATFYTLVAIYTVVVQPDAEQTVAQDLGADQGTFGMIAAGFMVICLAPVAEEFFFRGFFYRALRSRWSVLGAAGIDGLLFGVIHYDFSGADALLILPPLAVLGLHLLPGLRTDGVDLPHDRDALAEQRDRLRGDDSRAGVSLVLGPLMLLACATVPRAQRAAMA